MKDVSIAYYLYFLGDEDIKVICNKIAQKLKLDSMDFDRGAVEDVSDFNLIKSIEGPDMTLSLNLWANFLIVEIFFKTRDGYSLIEEIKAELKDDISNALGEAVLFACPVEDVKEIVPYKEILETGLKNGTLYEFLGEEKWEKYYAFTGPAGDERFFVRDFPLLDLAINKMSREWGYYRDLTTRISKDIKDMDREIGTILNKRLLAAKSSELEVFEDVVGELSKMYATLSSNTTVLKLANISVAGNMKVVRRRLDRILEKDGQNAIEDIYVNRAVAFQDSVQAMEEQARLVLEKIKDAINVIQTRVALDRSRETILLQHEGVSLQVATGFIEFILVFYYTLNSWKTFMGVEHFYEIVPSLSFSIVFGFTGSVVISTHFVAMALKEKKRLTWQMVVSFGFVLGFFLIMAGFV